jgi:hypothetical protein
MKAGLVILLLLAAVSSYATIPSPSEVRTAFQKAAKEERACTALIKLLEAFNEKNSPLLAGYRACATMMMAKYVFNPFTKLSYFSKGRTLLEKCIKADKQNIELRFLRYTVQRKAPFFLGYNSAIKEDGSILKNAVSQLQDTGLKKMITGFLTAEGTLK